MAFELIFKNGTAYYYDPGSGGIFDPSTGQWGFGDDPYSSGPGPFPGGYTPGIPDPGGRVQDPSTGYWFDPYLGQYFSSPFGGVLVNPNAGNPVWLPGDLPPVPPRPPATPPGTTPPGTTPPGTTPPGTTPPGTTPQDKRDIDWAAIIKAASSFAASWFANRNANAAARRAQEAAERQRQATLGYASPENYEKLYRGLLGGFRESFAPARRTIGETLGLGEQWNLQAFAQDAAQRGLLGSGLYPMGRASIRAGRQAMYNQALRGFETAASEGARQEAGAVQQRQISGSLGAPVSYFPTTSTYSQLLDAINRGVADYTRAASYNRDTDNTSEDDRARADWAYGFQ